MSTDLVSKGPSFSHAEPGRYFLLSARACESRRGTSLFTHRTRKHLFDSLAIVILLAIFATGCNKPAPSAWTLVLKVDPDHPRMVHPATFTVHIADSNGAPVDGAHLTGSLNMTLMNMGKTEVNFAPQGHGDYAATLKSFDMSGPWELTVDASQGSVVAHRVFQVTIFD